VRAFPLDGALASPHLRPLELILHPSCRYIVQAVGSKNLHALLVGPKQLQLDIACAANGVMQRRTLLPPSLRLEPYPHRAIDIHLLRLKAKSLRGLRAGRRRGPRGRGTKGHRRHSLRRHHALLVRNLERRDLVLAESLPEVLRFDDGIRDGLAATLAGNAGPGVVRQAPAQRADGDVLHAGQVCTCRGELLKVGESDLERRGRAVRGGALAGQPDVPLAGGHAGHGPTSDGRSGRSAGATFGRRKQLESGLELFRSVGDMIDCLFLARPGVRNIYDQRGSFGLSDYRGRARDDYGNGRHFLMTCNLIDDAGFR